MRVGFPPMPWGSDHKHCKQESKQKIKEIDLRIKTIDLEARREALRFLGLFLIASIIFSIYGILLLVV